MAKEYIERSDVLKKQRTLTEYDEGGWDAKVAVVEVADIKAIPAVDVVEVKHGQWVDRYNGEYVNPLYECSECKGKALYKAEVDVLDKEQFVQALSAACPHCGAKMDGEDGDGE